MSPTGFGELSKPLFPHAAMHASSAEKPAITHPQLAFLVWLAVLMLTLDNNYYYTLI